MSAALTYIWRGALGGMAACLLLLLVGLLRNGSSMALLIFYGFFVVLVSAGFGATIGAVVFLLSKLLSKTPRAPVRVLTGFALAMLAFALVLFADRNNPLDANKAMLDGILFYGFVGSLAGFVARGPKQIEAET